MGTPLLEKPLLRVSNQVSASNAKLIQGMVTLHWSVVWEKSAQG